MPPDDSPEEVVLALLDDEWNKSATFDVDPTITFGWFDRENLPEITVEQADGSPVRGGETGISGINPGDGTPRSTTQGVVRVHIWCDRPSIEALTGASTDNPRQFNEAAKQEIHRIVKANANRPTNPRTGNTDLNFIGPGARNPVPPETDESPVVFHYRYEVRYGKPPE